MDEDTCLKCLKQYFDHVDYRKHEKYKRILIFIVILFFILITVGTLIFQHMFNLTVTDALFAASMILTSIDIEADVNTDAKKWFVIIYAIIAVVLFLSMTNVAMGYLFTLTNF